MNNGYLGHSGNMDVTGPNDPTIAQQPVFLPAPNEQQPYFQPQQQSPYTQQVRPVRPEDLVRMPQTALPANPVARIGYLWKKEPAYRVLFIAISIVLLSSFIFVGAVSGMFNQSTSPGTQGGGTNPQQSAHTGGVSATSKAVSTPTPAPTTAPTPTPMPTPTPFPTQPPAPTEPPAPTQPPANIALTVQFSGPNPTEQNGQTIPVNVTTNEPGSNVHLVVQYDAFPYYTSGRAQTTDDAGNATISWRIRVTTFRPGATVTAQVTVVAQDQRGMYVTSPQMTVQITTQG